MPKLRKLRIMAAVTEAGSVQAATNALNLSQPAVTRALQALEAELDARLFDRHARSITATDTGRLLARRVRRALGQLRIAESRMGPISTPLSDQASDHELIAAVHVAQHGSVSAAARHAGTTQPGLNRSLNMLEKRLGREIFHRTTQGMRPTPEGEQVVRRIKLAYSEIRQGLEEVAFAGGSIGGRIRIGALPLTRVRLVPFAVEALLARYPKAEVSIVDGSYGDLLTALRQGDIDIIAGTVRNPPPVDDIASEHLFEDAVAIVAAKEHPLASQKRVTLAECMEWNWILPFKGVPLRLLLERAVAAEGLSFTTRIIETDSVVAARTLLFGCEYLAALSPHQIYYEEQHGLLKTLPVDVAAMERPVGLTTRRDFQPTPLADALLGELRRVSAEIAITR